MHGHDLHGEDGGVLGVVQAHAGDRHPGWHLGDRQQGVQAVHRAAPDRDTDHRKDRVRGDDAGQRRAHARAGDHDLDTARLELGHPVGQSAGRTVRGDARLVVADPEPRQHGTGLAHDVLVTGRPVDDGHSRAGAGRHGYSSGAGTPLRKGRLFDDAPRRQLVRPSGATGPGRGLRRGAGGPGRSGPGGDVGAELRPRQPDVTDRLIRGGAGRGKVGAGGRDRRAPAPRC